VTILTAQFDNLAGRHVQKLPALLELSCLGTEVAESRNWGYLTYVVVGRNFYRRDTHGVPM
jgi:hypothetical protein